jgi:TatD DNase family protein
MPFADIAVNLGDAMFEGSYHGRQKHVSDLQEVVARARERGVERMLLTGTSLEESAAVLKMAERFGAFCSSG